MRQVSLAPKRGGDLDSRLRWCEEMIATICRASQVNTPVQEGQANAGRFLKVGQNLSDVQNAAQAFNNIKQNASEEATGVVRFATEQETKEGESDSLATHPKGVAATILVGLEALYEAILDGVDEAYDTLAKIADALADKLTASENLSDVEDPVEAFDNIKQEATTTSAGVVEKATVSEVAAATEDKYISADLLEDAAALVQLQDAATISWDWKAGINFELEITTNRTLGNPSNGIPGTYRTIIVKGSGASELTLLFENQFGGEVPELSDITAFKWYELIIRCVTATHFVVSARDASPPQL